MKKLFIISALVLLFILGCAQNKEQTKEIKEPIIESETVNVEIKDFKFNPAEITIKKGTTVIWTQIDSIKHTITSDDGLFDSGLLPKGNTWSFTFNEQGTFKYHCTPHSSMKGTVVVE